jgi:hypothetical protein
VVGLAKTFGFGCSHKRTAAPASISPLTIVTAPVISGGTSVGSTLTVATPAVWSGTPASRIYQWYQDASPIALATGTSYVTVTADLSHSITVKEQANNGALSTPSQSNAIVVASSGGFATPTLSNFSALGAAPVVLQGSTADYVAGYRGQLQIATDSGFASITQNIIFFIDGNSWASNDIAIGLISPTGTYYARWRVVRDNEAGTTITGNDPLGNALSFGADVSSWSTTFTDTIVSSVAVLNSVNGANKNANIAVTGTPKLIFLGSGGVGAYCSVRATVEAQSDFTQWEVTITQMGSSDALYLGFGTSADSFSSFLAPGLTDATGVGCKIAATNVNVNWNSDGSGGSIASGAGTAQVNDIFALVLKKSTNQLSIYRTRSGTTTQVGTTQTIPSFASYFAYVSTRQDWGGTCNFGAAAFGRTLGGGEAVYG